ncbi:MAG: hydroxymethylbilane synthase [Cytophagales bacterium]|nr:hydroxymethylbilane synthase [Cytophagales bacterium]MDW8384825.1 hydroxymethylbilane synthase [Flammeovirgaceae bacterium]
MRIRIGTRNSPLALWQAQCVADLLRYHGAETELIPIETKGDKVLHTSIAKIGSKGVFTEELEEKLRNKEIDIAVHSAKDLPSALAEDLEIIAFTEREQVNDVVISFQPHNTLESKKPLKIGTSSTRRTALLRRFYPHHLVTDMRGNLQTRLRKLQEGACDAILLAYAGVHRMNYHHLIVQHLSTDCFTPAVGQGSIAVEASVSIPLRMRALVRAAVNHVPTEICLKTERAFLRAMNGGCSVPVFGFAHFTHQQLNMVGGIVSLDGSELIKSSFESPALEAFEKATELAQRILENGGAQILARIKSVGL